jgi:AcrR family transcriptional regulator
MHTLVDPADDPAVDDAPRRGRILWALATCMATKGYRATTISDIAAAAHVSKTVVYAHFPDKEHCLLELYSRANDKVLATVRRAQEDARRAGLPWRDRLRAGIGADHPDEVRPVSRDLLVAAVGGINELMLARVERGEAALLRVDDDVAADIVIGLLERRDRPAAPRPQE